jgi:glycine betaine catabolism A
MMQISQEIKDLIAKRREGYTLDAPFYQSAEIFDLDVAAIFGKHWIYVAVEPDVPEAGDYITVKIGHDSVIILRDDDMQIKAFHNVCRHRGARICNESKGTLGNIVCPYHQWTYNLEGKLIFTEHMGEDFDPSNHSLKSVHVGNIAGLIFICLADEPPEDFAELKATMEPYIAPHQLANTKIIWQEELVEEGNWKLTMENNRECYHCATNHPELTKSLYEYGFGYQPSPANADKIQAFNDTIEKDRVRWEACGLPSGELELLDTRVTGFRTQRLSLDLAGESQTMDGKVACKKLLGELTQRDLGGLSFWTQPNSWHHFMSDHIVTFSVIPLDAHHTLLRTKWLVHKDAVEGQDYDIKKVTEVWQATNRQDGTLVEYTHRGSSGSAYRPGPYSPFTEGLVEKCTNWYIQRLQAALENKDSTVIPIKVSR